MGVRTIPAGGAAPCGRRAVARVYTPKHSSSAAIMAAIVEPVAERHGVGAIS